MTFLRRNFIWTKNEGFHSFPNGLINDYHLNGKWGTQRECFAFKVGFFLFSLQLKRLTIIFRLRDGIRIKNKNDAGQLTAAIKNNPKH